MFPIKQYKCNNHVNTGQSYRGINRPTDDVIDINCEKIHVSAGQIYTIQQRCCIQLLAINPFIIVCDHQHFAAIITNQAPSDINYIVGKTR